MDYKTILLTGEFTNEEAFEKIMRYPLNYHIAPERIKRLKHVFLFMFNHIMTSDMHYVFDIPTIYGKQIKYMLPLVMRNHHYFQFCSDTVKKDLRIIKHSINAHGYIRHLSHYRQCQIRNIAKTYHLSHVDAVQHIINQKMAKQQRSALLKCMKTEQTNVITSSPRRL